MLEERSFITSDSNPCVNRLVGNLCVPISTAIHSREYHLAKERFKGKLNILLDCVVQLKHNAQYEHLDEVGLIAIRFPPCTFATSVLLFRSSFHALPLESASEKAAA
jgi:hypothetical protein